MGEIQVKISKMPIALGIISILSSIAPTIGILVSICGIVISSRKLKKHKCKAYKIGLILNIIGVILSILFFGILYICVYMYKFN